jgi:hydrogenase large subunit
VSTRITIDPVTRIEGHLRVDAEINNGKVTKAWSSGQMWRGVELILLGRDPRDAWTITQRICGVCTTVHAIASVRAVENALQLEVPLNAQYIRNMIISAHAIHDHIVHFYHLSAFDFVDVVSALSADPAKAAAWIQQYSDWPLNSKEAMKQTQDRLKAFVATGQLGPFTNGYWGHPAMKLSPEINLVAVAHYLQALEVQREANKIVTILGSKTPHIQNMAVGGVSNAIAVDSQSVLTVDRLMAIKTQIDKLSDFINKVYLIDVAAIGSVYANWTGYGAGIKNYLSAPDFPTDTRGTQFMYPGGYIPDGDLGKYQAIKNFGDDFLGKGVEESVKHSWYTYSKAGPLHPYVGETTPHYTDFQDDGKYSWLKAPTFYGKRAQVGPLAAVLNAVAAGHKPTIGYVTKTLDTVSSLVGAKVGVEALHSTVGRHAARAVRCAVLLEILTSNWQLLIDNIGRGDFATFNKPTFPKGEIVGYGFHEAPRGLLSHWIVIRDGKIANYQCVVPSTWNAGPRAEDDAPGPYEASLLDNPVANPEQPLEVLRTIHSFDPCLACAVHVHDQETGQAVRVNAQP